MRPEIKNNLISFPTDAQDITILWQETGVIKTPESITIKHLVDEFVLFYFSGKTRTFYICKLEKLSDNSTILSKCTLPLDIELLTPDAYLFKISVYEYDSSLKTMKFFAEFKDKTRWTITSAIYSVVPGLQGQGLFGKIINESQWDIVSQTQWLSNSKNPNLLSLTNKTIDYFPSDYKYLRIKFSDYYADKSGSIGKLN